LGTKETAPGPRRNRVDPLGALCAVPERGGLMGNRGCLHDADGRIVRGWAGRRWIACGLAFRGRRRAVMAPGRYTELFFLDEATAYAAGHRPCAECRRADWMAFRLLWAGVHGPADADAIDLALHDARLDGRARRLPPARWPDLPAGAMVLAQGAPALVTGAGLWRWSFAGYTPLPDAPESVALITPAPLVALMRAGLAVQVAGPAPGPALVPPQT
jgi:hypothetical protein